MGERNNNKNEEEKRKKRVPVENQFKSVFIPFELGMFFSDDG